MITKTTYGCVRQVFNDKGNCVSQEFIADDRVEWKDENGNKVFPPFVNSAHNHLPLDMVQPEE